MYQQDGNNMKAKYINQYSIELDGYEWSVDKTTYSLKSEHDEIFKELQYADRPTEQDGYYLRQLFEDTTDTIIQSWEYMELATLPLTEEQQALQILGVELP